MQVYPNIVCDTQYCKSYDSYTAWKTYKHLGQVNSMHVELRLISSSFVNNYENSIKMPRWVFKGDFLL